MVVKAAPDVLLARCNSERVAGEARPLRVARRAEILAAVERLADLALRPLAVAYRPLPGGTALTEDTATLERELVYLGMVGIIDPPRPESRAGVAEAAAGIRVLMITGDHPRTAARIAGDLGIAGLGSPMFSGAEIETLDEEGLRNGARRVSVYARVAPEQKLQIVEALQHDEQIVAMTGDGVNDAPALRSADIGVAVGVTGTDVAKEAADMILADDNFATIVGAGGGSSRTYASSCASCSRRTPAKVLTMFLGVMLAGAIGLDVGGDAVAVPLLATQILWINLLTDGAPALALGVDPPPDDVMRRPPRRLTDRVIDREMWIGIFWVGLVKALVSLVAFDLRLPGGLLGGSGDIDEARRMAFTTLVFAQLFNCFNARSDRTSAFHHLFANRWLSGAIALSVVLQLAVVQVPFMNDAFSTAPLGIGAWGVCVALASAVLWADEARKGFGRLRSGQ